MHNNILVDNNVFTEKQLKEIASIFSYNPRTKTNTGWCEWHLIIAVRSYSSAVDLLPCVAIDLQDGRSVGMSIAQYSFNRAALGLNRKPVELPVIREAA